MIEVEQPHISIKTTPFQNGEKERDGQTETGRQGQRERKEREIWRKRERV